MEDIGRLDTPSWSRMTGDVSGSGRGPCVSGVVFCHRKEGGGGHGPTVSSRPWFRLSSTFEGEKGPSPGITYESYTYLLVDNNKG